MHEHKNMDFRKSMRRTIIAWLAIAIMGAITLLSVKLAHAEEGLASRPKYSATIVLWYTADGKPHNIFIVDTAYLYVDSNVVVIDRTPESEPKDQILMGGLFDLQTFGYQQVFDAKGKLRPKFNNFAIEFKREASRHLGFRKDDRTQ